MIQASRRILFEFPGLGEGQLFDPGARDHVTEPFIYLRERVRELGYELVTADSLAVEDAAQVWFWDVPRSSSTGLRPMIPWTWRRRGVRPRDLLQECLRAGNDRIVLFIGEPAVVHPDNWDSAKHRPFSRILTWSDDLVDGSRYRKFRYPIPSTYPRIDPPPFRQRGLLVNISANKSSDHPNELYSARRETIRYFERIYPSQFALFGAAWDRPAPGEPPYPSFRGVVDHKWRVYGRFRFGLCYENMRDVPGYVTEKLFDCARAGSVPVYWGAPNITDYVDPQVFVDRTAFKSDSELARFLADIGEAEYQRYIEAADDYFRTERFAAFLPPTFAETVVDATQLRQGP